MSLYLPISDEERDRRWRRIREAMSLQDLDCLIIEGKEPAPFATSQWRAFFVTYVANLHRFRQAYVIFPLEGDPVTLEYGTVPKRGEAWTPVKHAGYPYALAIKEEIKARGLEEGRIGLVGMESVSAYVYDALLRALPKAHFEEKAYLLTQLIKVRSPEEMKFVRRSAELIDIGFEAMMEAAKPGKTEYEIHNAAISAICANGGHPQSNIILSSGAATDLPHEPTNRVLKRGDTINSEFASSPVNGYWSVQLCRPIALGEPHKEMRRIFEVCLDAYKAIEKELRPGKTYGEIEKMAMNLIRNAGYEPTWVALSYHVFPIFRSSADLRENLKYLIVEPGMDLINHPCVSTPDGKYLMFGNSMEITDTDPRSLSKIPLEYMIV